MVHTGLIKHMVLVLILGMLVSCASTPDELESYNDAIDTYEKLIRWREFLQARKYHKEPGEYDDKIREHLDQIRVTRYTVIQSAMDPGLQKATQVVDIRYYNDTYARERNLTVQQSWEYNPKVKTWMLTTPFPVFK